jgi:hypothetical protein
VQALAYMGIFAGALLLIGGLTGSTITSVAKGAPDRARAGAVLSAGPSSPAAPSGAPPSASGSWRARQQQIATAHGWSLADWNAVIQLESGGDPRSRNAESGAFGIGQFLPEKRAAYPKAFSSNPVDQIEAMGAYISRRYGTPSAALAHEHSFHWY